MAEPVFELPDASPELAEQVNKDYNSRGNKHNREVGKPVKIAKEALEAKVVVDGKEYKNIPTYLKKQKIEVLGYGEGASMFDLISIILIIIGVLCLIYLGPCYRRWCWGAIFLGLLTYVGGHLYTGRVQQPAY